MSFEKTEMEWVPSNVRRISTCVVECGARDLALFQGVPADKSPAIDKPFRSRNGLDLAEVDWNATGAWRVNCGVQLAPGVAKVILARISHPARSGAELQNIASLWERTEGRLGG